MPLIQRFNRRRGDSAGFVTIALMGVMLALMLLSAAAFAAAQGDLHISRNDQDQKRAYSAAEAGVANFFFHLSEDQAYWTHCGQGDPAIQPTVNQPLDWTNYARTIPGTTAQYTIELMPAPGQSKCDPTKAETSMIDPDGNFSIRATGKANGVTRSIIATFRREGFLNYLYYTDYETLDPSLYSILTGNAATRSGGGPGWTGPTYTQWAANNCDTYWRDGRGNLSWSGQVQTGSNSWTNWSSGCTEIQFANNDVVAGPLHTNDDLLICGHPTFGRNSSDAVTVSGSGWRPNCGGSSPNMVGNFQANYPVGHFPPTNTTLKNTAANGGYVFTGKTNIVLNGNTITVNGSSMPWPSNGVIYVDNGTCGMSYDPLNAYGDPAGCGDATVSGTYSKDITIAAAKDIIVNGDVTNNGDTMAGLIANGFVRVYHPVSNLNVSINGISCTNASGTMTNVTIDAAILSLAHSFIVDNYFCGAPLGTLTVNGTIAQKFRGPVGTSNGSGGKATGYTKNYTYDDRLKYRSPPFFLDPVEASWRILRYREQVPPAQ